MGIGMETRQMERGGREGRGRERNIAQGSGCGKATRQAPPP